MYWGGKDRMSEVMVATIAHMDGAGWAQHVPTGEYAPRPDPERPILIFRKDDQEIGASFQVSKTPRFGSKLEADSVRVSLRHHVLSDKERRRR